MKCQRCGKFLVKIGENKQYCKVCNLLFYTLVLGMSPRIFKMSESALNGES